MRRIDLSTSLVYAYFVHYLTLYELLFCMINTFCDIITFFGLNSQHCLFTHCLAECTAMRLSGKEVWGKLQRHFLPGQQNQLVKSSAIHGDPLESVSESG